MMRDRIIESNAKEESVVMRVLATSKNAGFGHPTEQLTSTLQRGRDHKRR